MSENELEFEEQAEDAQNTKKLLSFFVWVIILGVVGFCEVLYVAMMLPFFPDGFVRLVAIVGAAATGLSAVVLLAGKLHWFSKGAQSFAAWGFVAIETFILVCNVLLAIQLHGGQVASWMQWWQSFYAAAPVIAFVGWGIILYLDRSNLVRGMRRDQVDKHAKSELAYDHLLHQTKMKVKHTSLKMLSEKLHARIESAQNQEALDQIADRITNSVLGEISGMHVNRATTHQPPAVPQSHNQTGDGYVNKERMYDADEVKQMITESVNRVADYYLKEQEKMREKVAERENPLAQPVLDPQSSQNGTENGHSH